MSIKGYFLSKGEYICKDFSIVPNNIFIYGTFLECKIVLRSAGNIFKSQLLSGAEMFFNKVSCTVEKILNPAVLLSRICGSDFIKSISRLII
jgi:hypothetical protein